MTNFIHLHVHSEYSIINSTIRIANLIERAKASNMQAIALTDHANLFGVVKFYQAAIKHQIKPIIGVEIEVIKKGCYRAILLCQTYQGYQNLCELLTQTYIKKSDKDDLPQLSFEILSQYQADLIMIMIGVDSQINHDLSNENIADFQSHWADFQTLFGNRLYLGIKRTKVADDHFNACLFKAMTKKQISLPVVALNDVYFLNEKDHQTHLARVCIQQGIRLADQKGEQYAPSQYLKNSQQMCALFSDMPTCVENTAQIAKRCNVILPFGQIHLPQLQIGDKSSNQQLADQVLGELDQYLAKHPKLDKVQYQKRAEYEISIIQKTAYTDYFLIVSDFVCWAKTNNIPVGPGRGSGAGSLVAFMLKITDIDPVEYGLLFERFLNIDRVSMPDFDIDFCPRRRDEVIDYVMAKYGNDRVAQIITFGSMAAKAVVRDAGRVLGLSYGFVDEIASLIPFELDITLEKAIAQEPTLQKRYESDESVRALIDLSKQLEGLKRNIGKHAGGVVISPKKMTNFLALYQENSQERHITQLDKDDLEAMGLVKFDFLGLKNLTIIQDVLNALERESKIIDLQNIPLDDKHTFKLICQGKTQGIFQLESRGMRDIIAQLQPDKLDEIIDLCALYRPGPIESGMVDSYIQHKNEKKTLDLHPKITLLLEDTNGVILYQEQVMKIAQVLSNYSLGQADILRRIMGKKKPDEMQAQKAIFIEGAKKNNVPPRDAEMIFDHIEKFAGYGFNKSHSAAYGLIAYQTAYLKANFTAHFMAAVMTYTMEKVERLMVLIQESKSMGIKVCTVNIHESCHYFKAVDLKTIAYGLGAVKGLGKPVAEAIGKARSQSPFKSVEDVCLRVPLPDFGIRQLNIMIESGLLDAFGIDRGVLIRNHQLMMDFSKQHHHETAQSQSSLWGGQTNTQLSLVAPTEKERLSQAEILLREYKLLSQFASQHPLSTLKKEMKKLGQASFVDVARQGVQLLVWLIKKAEKMGQKKQPLLNVWLEDTKGDRQEFLADHSLWDEQFPKAHAPFVVTFERGYKKRLFIKCIQTLNQWRGNQKGRLLIKAGATLDVEKLKNILHDHVGNSNVIIYYQTKDARVEILLGVQVLIGDQLLKKLGQLISPQAIEVSYQSQLAAPPLAT